MNIKVLALYGTALMIVQFIIIAILTSKNKQFLDKYTGTSYAKALADLSKHRPKTVFAIRACYAACLLELVLILIYKYA